MSSRIVHVSDSNWESEVLKHDGLVLVDFWADWCGPCKMIAPIIDQVSIEMENVKVCKLNVDENQATAYKYQISGIPTMIVFKGGKAVDQVVGFTSKDRLKDALNRHL